ncbi:hypothetical protein BKA83DRAFT_4486808 [Pisolithus microcarpus]|nr:hypothetical protein BKA83DRAFT_4486808 [Pisolithus microcarpus]
MHEAFQWLKKNNPKYYGAIQISNECLDTLPEDDVPVEISSVIRQTEDVGIIEQESEGYVPQDNDDIHDGSPHLHPSNRSTTDPADVVPLQVSGMIDTEMATITACEMMAWGLSNLWEEGKEGGYAVRHGNQPVSDFGRPCGRVADARDEVDTKHCNFFEKVYPCLYPYGEGGIEGQQEVPVDFVDHIRWSL